MPEVFPYQSYHPLVHGLGREFIRNDMGSGYGQSITSEPEFERADGTGGIASHFGVNRFTLNFPSELDDSAETQRRANAIWDFFRARLDNGNEAFYYYNPSETLTIDLTGVTEEGRYLVRLADPNQVLNREYFAAAFFRYSGIDLVEVREDLVVSPSSSASPSA